MFILDYGGSYSLMHTENEALSQKVVLKFIYHGSAAFVGHFSFLKHAQQDFIRSLFKEFTFDDWVK